MPTVEATKLLVQQRIDGLRIGCAVPNYVHSWRVYDLLVQHGFSETICMAGLLHDTIEDSDITMEELMNLGYSAETLRLVDFATHDVTIPNSFLRWSTMLQRIITADDSAIWAVKLADIADNLTEMHLLKKPENRETFLFKKCPVFIYHGNHHFGGTPLFSTFLERYYHQVKEHQGLMLA